MAWSDAAWADCVTTTASGTVTLNCASTVTNSSLNSSGANPSSSSNYQAIQAPLNATVNSGATISGWGLYIYSGTQPASTTSRPLNVINNGMVTHTVGWDDPSESDGLNIGTNSGPIRYSGTGGAATNGTANAVGNFVGSTALVIGASGLGNSVTVGSLAAPIGGTFTGEGGIRLVAENSNLDAWFAGGTITATRRDVGVSALDIIAADSINLTMTGRTVVNGGIGVSLTAGPGHSASSLLTIATDAQVTNGYSAGAGLSAFSREAGANVTLTSGALFNVANIGVALSPIGGAARFTTQAGSTINQTGTTGAVRAGLQFSPTGTGSLVADLSGAIAASGAGLLLRPANGAATVTIRSGASVNGEVAGIQLSQAAGASGLVDIRNAGTLTGAAAVTGTTAGNAFALTNSGTINGAVNLTGSAVATSLLTNSGTWNLGAGNSVFSGGMTNSGALNLSDPGASANTLTVNGALTFGAGSNVRLDVGSTQATTDRILVSGAATLAGGLTAVARGGAFTSGTYTLLTANGGLSGAFSPLSTIPTSLAALRYDANNVFLDVSLATPGQSFSMSSRENLVFNAPTVTTNRVNAYSTQILGRLNGGAPLYDQTFGVPVSDPAAQAGLAAARAAITTASGPGVIVGAAVLTASSTATTSTSSTLYSVAGTSTTTASETTFGPATIQTGALSSCSVGALPSTVRPTCTTGGVAYRVGDAEENFNVIRTTTYNINQSTTTTDTTTLFEQWTLVGTVQAVGLVHTAVQSGALDAGSRFLRRVGEEASGDEGPFRPWAEGYGVWSQTAARGGAPGDDRTQYGLAAGFSGAVAPNLTLGVGIDHGRTDITLDRAFAESGDVTLTQIGVNVGLGSGPWFASLAGAYGFGRVDASHAIGGAAMARYDLRTRGLLAEAGYRLDLGGFKVTPSVGLDHTDVRSDGFTETGGLALTARGQSTGRGRIWAGLDVGQRLGDFYWSVYGRAVEVVSGNERLLPVTFYGAPMTIEGVSEAKSGGDVGARAGWRFAPGAEMFARYDGRFRDGFSAHVASAGVRITF